MTFLLISQKDGCLWAVFVAYLLRGFFSKAEIWSQELQFNYKFLTNATKQAFSMPTKCRTSFSGPFLDYYDVLFTKLLAMLRNGLFHRLPSRRMFFVRQSPEIFHMFLENRIVQSSGTSQKRYFCNSQPGHNEDGVAEMPMVRCKPAAGRFPPLLGKSRTNMGDLNLLTQLSTCFVLFCDWRIGTHQFSLHTLCS